MKPNKWHLVLYSCLVFCLSFSYYYKSNDILDVTIFGGDIWEYQSLAVNLLLGHGYQEGGVEDFSVYKFGNTLHSTHYPHYPIGGKPQPLDEYFESGGKYTFYRTPGYPLFLSFLYRVFGIHPRAAKIGNMILLALSASLLPILGWYYWNKTGIISGSISAFLFVQYYSQNPVYLMSEPLIVFSLAVWTLFFMSWQRSQTIQKSIMLGIMSGVLLYIKGLMVFLPAIFLIYLFCRLGVSARSAKLGIVYVLGCILLILPWSLYGYSKLGRFILLSTQFQALAVDSNNEESLTTGSWHPAWRKERAGDMYYLANRPEYQSYPAIVKVLRFWYENSNNLPRLFGNKLYLAFGRKDVLLILSLMLLYYSIVLRPNFFGSGTQSIQSVSSFTFDSVPVFPLLYLLNVCLITLLFYGYFDRFVMVFMHSFLLPAIYLPFHFIKAVLYSKMR